MINLNDISLSFDNQLLYQHVNLTFHAKQKIGLVGANGSGKTSLFALLLNQLEPTEGEIKINGDIQVASVEQEISALDISALEYVIRGDDELYQLQQAITDAEQNDQHEKLGNLYARMTDIDGYSASARAAQLLNGLGFSQSQFNKSVAGFSGGWRMRLNLARALMCRSDLLLLDEPTNHLDLDAIIWLEKWLQQYQGIMLLISHDRDFLDKIIDHVASIEHQKVTLYTGDYSDFERQRAAQLANQQAMYEKQQKQIAHMQKYIDRFRYKASKAKQAQSRIKALARMETVAAVQAQSEFHFEFLEPETNPYPLISVDDADIGYSNHTVLNKIRWRIGPGDRIGLLGANGAGKTTFLKTIAGELNILSGTVTHANGVKIGYFAQHQLEHLNPDQNAMSHMQKIAGPKYTQQQLRNYLGGFGFSGDAVFKSIGVFSGGEKARLALALIVWQRPNLLLLDEPTNHLDMEMRMALNLALQSYQGAVLLVSHDRYLLRNTVDQLLLIADGKLQDYKGDLRDYYHWLLQQKRQADVAAPEPEPEQSEIQQAPSSNVKKKGNPQKLVRLEKDMESVSEQLQVISEQLSDPAIYEGQNAEKREQLFAEQKKLQQQLEEFESQWLQMQE